MWIRRDFLDDAIAPLAVRIRQSIKQCAFFWILDRVLEIAPLLVEESFAIGDEKLEVARVGLIDMRIIDSLMMPCEIVYQTRQLV